MKHVAIIASFVAALAAPHASAQVAVTSQSVMEHAARPGEVYEGRVVLLNTSNEVEEARLYLTDYAFHADGRNAYPAPGTTRRSNASWISFSPSTVTLSPGASATVNFRVAVPAASAGGSHWSMLMAETVMRGSAVSSLGPRQVRVGMDTKIRYGTQIATHVGGQGVSNIAFDSVRALQGKSGAQLAFDFVNTGDRAHRLTISLQLYTDAGDLVRTMEQRRGLLYPGTSGRQQFDLGKLPPGTYRALVVADGGGSEIFGGQYTVRF